MTGFVVRVTYMFVCAAVSVCFRFCIYLGSSKLAHGFETEPVFLLVLKSLKSFQNSCTLPLIYFLMQLQYVLYDSPQKY